MKMAFQAGFKEKRNRMRGLFQALCRPVFLSQFFHKQPVRVRITQAAEGI